MIADETCSPRLASLLAREGYSNLARRNGTLHGLQSFVFTTGLVVGLDATGYERRYCYERAEDTAQALSEWDGHGHPGGPWIKCKGTGIDLLNPNTDEF